MKAAILNRVVGGLLEKVIFGRLAGTWGVCQPSGRTVARAKADINDRDY